MTKTNYRGKYPTRINGVSGSTAKGVYIAYVNNGQNRFFAVRDAIAAGFTVEPGQVIGREVGEFAWMQATIEQATARQRVESVNDYLIKLQSFAAYHAQHAAAYMRALHMSDSQDQDDERNAAISHQERARDAFIKSANVRGLFDTPEQFEQPDESPAALAASVREQGRSHAFALADDGAHFNQPYMLSYIMNPGYENIVARILIERAVIRHMFNELIGHGFTLRIYDGEEWSTERTQDTAVLMSAIMACDDERIHVLRPSDKSVSGYTRVGVVNLVYGNDGYDVLSDYSMNLEPMLTRTNAFSDAIGDCL